MLEKIRRGAMYYADLNPVVGSEQGGVRPVLVIQNNVGNQYSPTVIVAAISGKIADKTKTPTHYLVRGYAGLKKESLVLLEQIRTIDKQRLRNHIGQLSEEDMKKVSSCLAVSLELKSAVGIKN